MRAFISYRRLDSDAAARSLKYSLDQAFGSGSAFMDSRDIAPGSAWPQDVDAALARSAAVLAVIGRQWLRLHDEHHRRLIDRDDDWVRRELVTALSDNKPTIPIVLEGVHMPPADALPASLAGLTEHRAVCMREATWDADVEGIIERLLALGFRRTGRPTRVPILPRDASVPRPCDDRELEALLRELPKWESVTSPLPGRYPRHRTELSRTYKFKTFEQALAFMSEAAIHIAAVQHHPRWENSWRTVTVWLTTWDSGHVITHKDVELARYLDELFRKLRA